MYKSKLINKKAYITDKDSIYFNDWGIIKSHDNGCYYIAMFNDSNSMPIFNRNQFQIIKIQ